MSDVKTASYNLDRHLVTRIDAAIESGATYAPSRGRFVRACVEGHLRNADTLSRDTLAYKWAERQLYVELIEMAAPWKLRNTVLGLGGIDRLMNIHADVQAREAHDLERSLRQAILTQFKVPREAFSKSGAATDDPPGPARKPP